MSQPYRLPQVEEQTVLDELEIRLVSPEDYPRFQSLLRRHHYLQGIKPVGERLYYVAWWRGHWLALLVFCSGARPTRPAVGASWGRPKAMAAASKTSMSNMAGPRRCGSKNSSPTLGAACAPNTCRRPGRRWCKVRCRPGPRCGWGNCVPCANTLLACRTFAGASNAI